MPSGQGYLCATIGALRGIQNATSSIPLRPEELASGIRWTSPNSDIFTRCRCPDWQSPGKGEAHFDPVQLLLHKGDIAQLDVPQTWPIGLETLPHQGAVIFGHTPFLDTRISRGSHRLRTRDTPESSGSTDRGQSTPRSHASSPQGPPSTLITIATSIQDGVVGDKSLHGRPIKKRKISWPDKWKLSSRPGVKC